MYRTAIDSELHKRQAKLRDAKSSGNTTKLWDLWSKAVEKAWLSQLYEVKESDHAKMGGRGTFATRKQLRKRTADADSPDGLKIDEPIG